MKLWLLAIMVIFIVLTYHWVQVGEIFKAWIDIVLAGVCLALYMVLRAREP